MTPADVIQHRAELLVRQAAREGVVLTIEQVPLQPPAMGHYRTTVSVRQARVMAEPRRPFNLDELCHEATSRIERYIDEIADDAIFELGLAGIAARVEMEERHHGSGGAGWQTVGWRPINWQPQHGEKIMISIGGGGGARGVMPGEPVVGGPL